MSDSTTDSSTANSNDHAPKENEKNGENDHAPKEDKKNGENDHAPKEDKKNGENDHAPKEKHVKDEKKVKAKAEKESKKRTQKHQEDSDDESDDESPIAPEYLPSNPRPRRKKYTGRAQIFAGLVFSVAFAAKLGFCWKKIPDAPNDFLALLCFNSLYFAWTGKVRKDFGPG